MSYLFQAILLVAVSAYAMLIEPLWSWSDLAGRKSFPNLFPQLAAAFFGFALYSLIDYSIFNYLMLIPGGNHVIA